MSSGKFGSKNNKAAKLTASQVQDIRALYAAGDSTQGELARDFQISVVQIGRIVRGEVWQSLPALAPSSRQLEESAKRLLALQADVRAEEPTGLTKLQEQAKEQLKGNTFINELVEGEHDAGYD